MEWVRRPLVRRASGGAILAATLLVLAEPPFGLLPLSFLALTPLALALAWIPAGVDGRRAAAWTGFLFGIVFWGVSLIWIPLVVGPEFPWAYGGYLVLLLLLGSLAAGLGWLVHGLHQGASVPLSLALPLGWVAVEWIKGHVPLGLAFPWLGLGVTLTGWPQILGLAEWLGESGVAFWLAGVSGLVADALLASGRRRSWTLGAGALAALVLPAMLGVARARGISLEDGPSVAAIGTAIPVDLRDRPAAAAQAGLEQVEEATKAMAPGEVDLLVLPEGLVPQPERSSMPSQARGSLESLARRIQAPILFGGLGGTDSQRGVDLPTNSAFLLPLPPDTLLRYDKTHLVPTMEVGRYEVGSGTPTLETGGLVVGILICYESLFGGLARAGRQEGAQLLVNLSSDIWFGRQASLVGSLFLHQHPAHLVLRAVELRAPVARAGNGGYTFLLDPLGRYVAGPVLGAGVSAVGTVPTVSSRTLFSRTGDWVGPGTIVACGFLLFLAHRRRRSGPSAPKNPRGRV